MILLMILTRGEGEFGVGREVGEGAGGGLGTGVGRGGGEGAAGVLLGQVFASDDGC